MHHCITASSTPERHRAGRSCGSVATRSGRSQPEMASSKCPHHTLGCTGHTRGAPSGHRSKTTSPTRLLVCAAGSSAGRPPYIATTKDPKKKGLVGTPSAHPAAPGGDGGAAMEGPARSAPTHGTAGPCRQRVADANKGGICGRDHHHTRGGSQTQPRSAWCSRNAGWLDLPSSRPASVHIGRMADRRSKRQAFGREGACRSCTHLAAEREGAARNSLQPHRTSQRQGAALGTGTMQAPSLMLTAGPGNQHDDGDLHSSCHLPRGHGPPTSFSSFSC